MYMYMYIYIYIYTWIHDALTHSFRCIVRLSPIIDPRPLASRGGSRAQGLRAQGYGDVVPQGVRKFALNP